MKTFLPIWIWRMGLQRLHYRVTTYEFDFFLFCSEMPPASICVCTTCFACWSFLVSMLWWQGGTLDDLRQPPSSAFVHCTGVTVTFSPDRSDRENHGTTLCTQSLPCVVDGAECNRIWGLWLDKDWQGILLLWNFSNWYSNVWWRNCKTSAK